MTARRAVLAAACAGALAAGCSTGSINVTADQAQLQSDVLALTQASATHDWPAAGAAMDQLRSDLADAIAAGRISAARAAAIRMHLAAVAADIGTQSASASTPSTSSTTPKPKPTPPPPAKKHKPGHGQRDGNDDGD